jgi:hypothetical protein
MSDQETSPLLGLPSAFLALLVQQTASGPDGLASAAALSQTCKHLHSLSEGSAVTYRNIHVQGTVSRPAHKVWQWLAKRRGRVAGLSMQLCFEMSNRGHAENDGLRKWTQPLQILSGIPSVQLEVEWYAFIGDRNHLCLTQWLRQHAHTVNYLTVYVPISEDRLKLRDFAEAAAPCRSIDLSIEHETNDWIDLAELAPLSGCLVRLASVCDTTFGPGVLRGLSALSSLHQLTSFYLVNEDLTHEELWGHLAKCTNIKYLFMDMTASGDPSSLSALTRLVSLTLDSRGTTGGGVDPFSFSSLQPLSTLHNLEYLQLEDHACTATSLQGLGGLSKLKQLDLDLLGGLRSLEGIGSGVTELRVAGASDLVSLAGLESCSSLQSLYLRDSGVSSLLALASLISIERFGASNCCLTSLEGLCGTALKGLGLCRCSSLTSLSGIEHFKGLTSLGVGDCGVTSLQPLSQIGEKMERLSVQRCYSVQEEVLELPHVQPSAFVGVYVSNVREVVLAGGVRRAVGS